MELNANPDAYQALAIEKARVPQNIEKTVKVPVYPVSRVPSKEQWEDMMAWMKEKRLVDTPPTYESTVTAEFF